MKVHIISDIILNPLIKEFKQKKYNIELNIEYFDDINLGLKNFNFLTKSDIYFIHSDQYFHKKPPEWQLEFLYTLNSVIINNPKISFVISNSLTKGYTLNEISASAGSIFDTFKFYNKYIEDVLNNSNAFIFDFTDLIFGIGFKNAYNFNLGFLYQMPYTKELLNIFSESIYLYFEFLKTEEKKVVVLDCDNTLWGGIIGEDGIRGIKCDKTSSGIIYYNFQLFLTELLKSGFVLCLCSKNNIEDVKNAFLQLNMPLKWNDFLVKEVNWNDKSENIKKISSELNVSESSFIFIDDNLFELEIVKNSTSVNTIFQQNEDYLNLLEIMKSLSFRRKFLTEEDRIKHELYNIEIIRKSNLNGSLSKSEFIKSLEINIEVNVNDREVYKRLSQMTEKTNQFNFNKNPLTENDFVGIEANGGMIFSMSLFDKFGAYGIVGLIIISKENDLFILNNYLLSCRALGKDVETTFFKYVKKHLEKHNIIIDHILFRYNEKNIPAQLFLKQIENEYNIRKIE